MAFPHILHAYIYMYITFFSFFIIFLVFFYIYFCKTSKRETLTFVVLASEWQGRCPASSLNLQASKFSFLCPPGATKSLGPVPPRDSCFPSLFFPSIFIACGRSRLPNRYFDAKCWVAVAAPSRIHGNTRKVSGADKAHTTRVNDCCPDPWAPWIPYDPWAAAWSERQRIHLRVKQPGECVALKFN